MTKPTRASNLLNDIEVLIKRFVVCSPEQRLAIALWIVHTHALDAAEYTPYLGITSARPDSGKTQILRVVELLVPNPLRASAISDSAAFRDAATEPTPTLLIDELDNVFSRNNPRSELRAILNSGNERRGSVRRTVKQEDGSFSTEGYSQFSAKAFAGIGKFPSALRSRCILIEMKRPDPGAEYEKFRRRNRPAVEKEAAALKQRIGAWAKRNTKRLIAAEPCVPEALYGRKEDLWEPLFAIADALSGEVGEVGEGTRGYAERARKAALTLSFGGSPDREVLAASLIKDVRSVFPEGGDSMRSNRLADALASLGSPWDTYSNGKPITTKALSELLRPFGVTPEKMHYVQNGKRKNASFYMEEAIDKALADKSVSTLSNFSNFSTSRRVRKPIKAGSKTRRKV